MSAPVDGQVDFSEPRKSEDHIFVSQGGDVKGDLPSNSFNIEEEGGGEVDYSLAVNGVVGISGIDWFLQPGGGEGMFSDKSPIKAGDACATVNKSMCVDGFQGLRGFNKLNRDLHEWGSFYMNCS